MAVADELKFYGVEFSYYSGKVRSYLRFKRIPFTEIKGTREVYKEVIVPTIGYPVLPVIETTDGEFVQDTTEIIDFLEQKYPENSVYPSTPKQKLVALLLEQYADEWLLLPGLYYRWCFLDYNAPFIYHEFGGNQLPNVSDEEKRQRGEKVCSFARDSVPFLGIDEKTGPAIEAWYTELLAQLNTHFTQHRFLLGDKPSIADFGLMGPFYAHLCRDPYPMIIMQNTAPKVHEWVMRMNMLHEIETGDFLADDQVPETLEPILARLFAEQAPVVADTAKRLSAWRKENPDAQIPRMLDPHKFKIGDAESERLVVPFNVWMFQRPLDFYHSLDETALNEVDALLHKVNGKEAMAMEIGDRVARKNYQLVFE